MLVCMEPLRYQRYSVSCGLLTGCFFKQLQSNLFYMCKGTVTRTADMLYLIHQDEKEKVSYEKNTKDSRKMDARCDAVAVSGYVLFCQQ